jgi:hypothetical protein
VDAYILHRGAHGLLAQEHQHRSSQPWHERAECLRHSALGRTGFDHIQHQRLEPVPSQEQYTAEPNRQQLPTQRRATKVWANHLLKFGVDLRKNQFNIYNPGGTGNSGWFTGNYTFTGEITSATHNSGNIVNSLGDFLLGSIKTSGYSLPQPPAGRRNYNLGAFVQDDWKVTPRLTVISGCGMSMNHR